MDTNTLAVLRATHELYCQLTGQKLSLERLWYEFLRAGFSARISSASSLTSKRKSAPAAATSVP
jgi:hypothetical protein